MSSVIASTRLSVLDRSRTREGYDEPAALRDTVRLAQELEALGYHRFWAYDRAALLESYRRLAGIAGLSGDAARAGTRR